MPCVHYRFFSKPAHDAIIFDGLHITLGNLRHQIMRRAKLRHCDLLITSEQTNTEYTDDDEIIPNNTTVIIKRIPRTGKSKIAAKSQDISSHVKSLGRSSEQVKCSSLSLEQLLKTENLAEADASEEDKIKAVMFQSSLCYYSVRDALNLVGVRPSNYICFRCGIPGHHIQFCPQKRDPGVAAHPKRIRKSTGIPRSFLVEVDDPSKKGVMLSSDGKYVIPRINFEEVNEFKNGPERSKFPHSRKRSSSPEPHSSQTQVPSKRCQD